MIFDSFDNLSTNPNNVYKTNFNSIVKSNIKITKYFFEISINTNIKIKVPSLEQIKVPSVEPSLNSSIFNASIGNYSHSGLSTNSYSLNSSCNLSRGISSKPSKIKFIISIRNLF